MSAPRRRPVPLAHVSLLASLLLAPQLSFARPEYAARERLSCTACHVTPWGGGPRTILGKTYGAHGLPPSSLSTKDVYFVDLRWVAYRSLESDETKGGLATMEAAGSANVPVLRADAPGELRALVTFDASPLGTQLRDAYARWRLGPDSSARYHAVFGRFYSPFGLMTDEHRTYTRIQTNSTLNTYNTGGAISADLGKGVHADLAALDALDGTGAFNGPGLSIAGVANLRWQVPELPILVGLSGEYYRAPDFADPSAVSAYSALWLGDRISVNLEGVLSWNWSASQLNPGYSRFFAGIQSSGRSEGLFGKLGFWLNRRWVPYYRFDSLDRDTRHGVGLEAFLNSNLTLNARVEKAFSKASSGTLTGEDSVLAMLRLWF